MMRPKHFKRGALCLLIACLAPLGMLVSHVSAQTASFTPNDPGYQSNPQPLDQVGAPQAWNFATCAGVTVAVVDSGVTPINDLTGALVPGWNIVGNNADTSDQYGHGTAVASVIGAAVNNALGTAGLCSAAKIMPVKVSETANSTKTTDVAAGIAWAADHGAAVINVSKGVSYAPAAKQLMTNTINRAVMLGATVVVSAGNDGSSDPDMNEYASASDAAIRVGGADPNGALDPESNRGGSWVDVAAPYWVVAEETAGDKYALTKGTSYAAPIVSAAAAMLKGKAPQLTPAQIKSLLMSSCTQTIDRSLIGCGGVVNVPAALTAAGFLPPSTTSTTATTATRPIPRTARINLSVRGKGTVKLAGKQCRRACRLTTRYGLRLTAAAVPTRGWRLAGWQGLCKGAKPKCSLKARPGRLAARFVKKK